MLLEPMGELGNIHKVLVSEECKMQELWGQEGFHLYFDKRPGKLGSFAPERTLYEAVRVSVKGIHRQLKCELIKLL